MKKLNIILLAFMLISYSAFSQGPSNSERSRGNSERPFYSISSIIAKFEASGITVTDTQKNKIKEIYNKSNEEVEQLNKEKMNVIKSIREKLSEQGTSNKEEIKALIMKKSNIEGLIEYNRVVLGMDIMDLFTESERELFLKNNKPKMHNRNNN